MPHAPDLSGHALDARYELHELIGEGAFGRVYRGQDRRLARPVAVKVIKPWWSEDPDWVRSFEREAQLLARVSDPGIVQIFDVGRATEGVYYVAELVDGGSLAERLEQGALPPWEACALATQLCSALGQAHAHGVVHRDVKPANVLITAAGRVKVGDFGVALLAEGTSDAALATVVGTPRYMAPEQAQGQLATPATDIYSVGIVLYEMLSGHPPFAGASSVELALKHLHDAPPSLSDEVPTALELIALRAMAKSPGERYSSAGAMAEALVRAARTAGDREPARSRTRGGIGAAAGGLANGHASGRQPPGRRRNGHDGAPGSAGDTAVTVAQLTEGRRRSAHARRPAGGGDDAVKPPGTLIAPRRGRRQNVNPPARRRTLAVFGAVGAVLLALAAGGILLARPSKGSPPPVKVPRLKGENSTNARLVLRSLGFRVAVSAVPAPGVNPGIVTQQRPGARAELAPGSRVTLFVAEVPRWRPLTSFDGTGPGRSVPFRIRGTQWRIVYGMGYQGTCTLIFVCSGPSARVSNLAGGSGTSQFDLNEGENQTQNYSGAGLYQVSVTPGDDSARWSMTIEDYY